MSVIEEEMAPHLIKKYHFHKLVQQLFYIISGTSEFEIENKKYIIVSGQSFILEPKLNHRIINKSGINLRFIVISQASNKNDRYEEGKDFQ